MWEEKAEGIAILSMESHTTDKKSLKIIDGKTADWNELAKDCVCFANSQGGRLLIGIENNEELPPAGQKVSIDRLDRLRKRINELTVNVQVFPTIVTAENGGQFIEVAVSRSPGVASTCDGRYFLRVGQDCQPVLGDDVLRLADERPGLTWETIVSLGVARSATDKEKLKAFVGGIRDSDRVKASVKDKSPDELLEHYGLASGEVLTHLGILLLGSTFDRSRLGTAPVVQFIKYDEQGQKVNKLLWDDYSLSPLELVDAVWREVPDFRESYEVAEGMFRRSIPAFDEKVIRELLVNALVHRPYTQRGDIIFNLHPDRLEIVNPGRLPLGVTPQNILHASRRRNEGLARVFHDLKLMEREGSGFDLIYDRMLSSGRPVPIPAEGPDWVSVTIHRRIVKPQLIGLLEEADKRFQLSQRERITLGVLAQSEGMTARSLVATLEVGGVDALKPWVGRLLDLGLIGTSGRTKGLRYFVSPDLLRDVKLDHKTTLSRITPHRLRALILEDLARYPDSSSGDINRRIGAEISSRTVKRALDGLIDEGRVKFTGKVRWRRYRLTS